MHANDPRAYSDQHGLQLRAILGPDGRDTGRTEWVRVPLPPSGRGEALTVFAVAFTLVGGVIWPLSLCGLPLSVAALARTRGRPGAIHGWAFAAVVLSVLELALTLGIVASYLISSR